MPELEWKLFEPEEVERPELLIIPNHLGSSVEDDFGHKAELMAQDLGMVVLSYNRPGTGTDSLANLGRYFASSPSRYIKNLARVGQQLGTIADQHGFDEIILTGNSAGASEAALLALTETVDLKEVVLADPVGLKYTNMARGLGAWAWHEYRVKPNRPDEQVNKEGGPESADNMIVRAATDMALYGRLWRSDLTLQALRILASHPNFADKAIHVGFPEHTFSDPTARLQAITVELNGLRPESTTQPFTATLLEGMYHSAFDDPHWHAGFVANPQNPTHITRS